MTNILIETALARRWFVLALALVLAGLGVRAFQQIPIDAFPDVSTTQVKLILKAPGMTPEEVEARIAQPIEMELLGIPKQTMLRSQSKICAGRHHRRFRGRHRHLLGAPAGGRALRQRDGRPAGRRLRRPGADHHAAVRDVHVHHRRRRCRWRNGAPCSTGRSGRNCARFPAWPTSTRSAAALRTFEVAPDPAALAARGVTLTN